MADTTLPPKRTSVNPTGAPISNPALARTVPPPQFVAPKLTSHRFRNEEDEYTSVSPSITAGTKI